MSREQSMGAVTASLERPLPVFLSTTPVTREHRYLVLALIGTSILVFLAAVPFAKVRLPQLWAFIPAYEATLVLMDAITAVLLFSQSSITRRPELAILAGGYLFTSIMAGLHALSFPGLFAPAGVVGGGSQTTAWLYMFWHMGFPLFVTVYASFRRKEATTHGTALWGGAGFAVAVGLCVLAWFASTRMNGVLPDLLREDLTYTDAMYHVVNIVWATSLMALVVLVFRRAQQMLDLWLCAVVFAWLVDVALSAQLNSTRFDLGFYVGRIYGLLASSFVLVMFLMENTKLYADLRFLHQQLTQQNEKLQREIHQRMSAERSLQQVCDDLEQRVHERTAQLEEAINDLESVTSAVSHDLKVPLRGVLGYCAILRQEHSAELSGDGREALSQIDQNAMRLQLLVQGLLKYSQASLHPLVNRAIDMRGVLADAVQDASLQEKVTVSTPVLPDALGEARLIRQVWFELLCNAAKFSANTPNAQIAVGAFPGRDETVYFVRDQGIGFDPSYQGKLFRVFERIETEDGYSGAGIGLALVHRIVSRHNGRAWAEGRPGEGATFYFSLPTCQN